MKENVRFTPENREILPSSRFTVTVIGDACSGKTTLLRYIKEHGYDVDTEPENPMMNLFIENPKKYAFQNQVHKSAQLIEREAAAAQSKTLTNPYFRETGLLGTDIYNRYLHDQGLITRYELDLLEKMYRHNLHLLPKPDLIVYLYADDETIRDRALKRDGVVAHDPQMLQPYWDRLLADLENSGTPILRLNTGENLVDVTVQTIMQEIEPFIDEKKMSEESPLQKEEPPQRKEPQEAKTASGVEQAQAADKHVQENSPIEEERSPITVELESIFINARFTTE